MAVVEITNPNALARLFADWREPMILSFLQGYMGRAQADDANNPRSARIAVGDFCALAGAPSAELVRSRPGPSDFFILVPQNAAWQALIEAELPQAVRITRYATAKDTAFDAAVLRRAAQLPAPYALQRIDQPLYRQILSLPWAQDLCANFASYEAYAQAGLGVVALKGGEVLSGASSYAVYEGGIEIEIDTRPDERRKGLALACGAQLILDCLARGLYPNWDAHDQRSLSLAEKLGYRLARPYTAYEVTL